MPLLELATSLFDNRAECGNSLALTHAMAPVFNRAELVVTELEQQLCPGTPSKPKTGRREPSEANVQRAAARQAWIIEIVRGSRKRPASKAELLRRLVQDARHSISKDTLSSDLRTMISDGRLKEEEAPPGSGTS